MRAAIIVITILGLLGCKKPETVTTEKKLELVISDKLSIDFKQLFDTTQLEKVSIGDLYLPTGNIVASDPFFIEDVKPFNKKIDKGSYPVELLIYKVEENHYRVAFAKIKFSDNPATYWELAITDEITQEDVNNLRPGEFFGYGVDAGLGCFTDLETARLFSDVMNEYDKVHPDRNYYDEVLADEFRIASAQHQLSRDLGDWNNHFLKKDSKDNVIMFSSGWGDGFYATYWGIDSTGKIVELITDFGVIGGE